MAVAQIKALTLSDAGFRFMTQPSFDSFQAIPYKDSGGLWTVGYGQRISEQEAENYKAGISEQFAKQLFDDFIAVLVTQISKCPLAGLFQYQNDAMLSLAYNIGFGAFVDSTIYKQLMVRSTDLHSWLWYVRDQKGHVDSGLVRRRQKELKLFIYGVYNEN